MSEFGQHLFEMLKEQNEAYRMAFQAGYDAGFRAGKREGAAEAQDKIRKMLSPPNTEVPVV